MEACAEYDRVVFFTFFLEFLDENFIIFYVETSQIKCTKMAHPSSKTLIKIFSNFF